MIDRPTVVVNTTLPISLCIQPYLLRKYDWGVMTEGPRGDLSLLKKNLDPERILYVYRSIIYGFLCVMHCTSMLL